LGYTPERQASKKGPSAASDGPFEFFGIRLSLILLLEWEKETRLSPAGISECTAFARVRGGLEWNKIDYPVVAGIPYPHPVLSTEQLKATFSLAGRRKLSSPLRG